MSDFSQIVELLRSEIEKEEVEKRNKEILEAQKPGDFAPVLYGYSVSTIRDKCSRLIALGVVFDEISINSKNTVHKYELTESGKYIANKLTDLNYISLQESLNQKKG